MADHRPAAAGPARPRGHCAVFARFAVALTRLLHRQAGAARLPQSSRRARQAGQGA